MPTQIISLVAHVPALGGTADIAARLSEPSAATVLLIAFAGVLIGRFMLSGKGSSPD